jgi:uracil phosphoribosyltransferase
MNHMITILSETNSIANRFLYEMRSGTIQQDPMRFRLNVERIGELFAYEISKTLQYEKKFVETPLGSTEEYLPVDDLVIGSILRAGIPLHQGLLRIFDQAKSAFFSAYRKHHKDGSFEIKLDYQTCPEMDDSTFILADPMLATGASTGKVLKSVLACGKPAKIHFVTIVASTYGIDYIHRHFPEIDIWALAVDEELTAKSYIVPGLGDAGDLMFGPKIND